MSVTVTVTLNGVEVPLELADDALASIAVADRVAAHRFLSKAALAVHYGVSERTIRTWRERGLPGIRCGREVMYPVDECDRWIERQA